MLDIGHILTVSRGLTPGGVGIYLILLLIALRYLKEWRETRKLSSEDRFARREGYAKQVENLQDENRELSKDLRDLREEYDGHRKQCFAETQSLREDLQRKEAEIVGLFRKVADLSIRLARLQGLTNDDHT